jgi:chemotaxis signal transduction protein
MSTEREALHLVARAGDLAFALPLASVIETMRPQPVRPVPGAEPWFAGIATIRGESVPVIAVAVLLGRDAVEARRFVTVRAEGRAVALACTSVAGLRRIEPAELPPLARAAAPEAFAALARADGELCTVLSAARLLPAAVPQGPPA